MAKIPKSNVATGNVILASDLLNVVEALDGTDKVDIVVSGSVSIGNNAVAPANHLLDVWGQIYVLGPNAKLEVDNNRNVGFKSASGTEDTGRLYMSTSDNLTLTNTGTGDVDLTTTTGDIDLVTGAGNIELRPDAGYHASFLIGGTEKLRVSGSLVDAKTGVNFRTVNGSGYQSVNSSGVAGVMLYMSTDNVVLYDPAGYGSGIDILEVNNVPVKVWSNNLLKLTISGSVVGGGSGVNFRTTSTAGYQIGNDASGQADTILRNSSDRLQVYAPNDNWGGVDIIAAGTSGYVGVFSANTERMRYLSNGGVQVKNTGTVNVGLDVDGGLSLNVVSKTTTYTATVNDYVILCNANGGGFTVTLPQASGSTGQMLLVKKTDSSANTVIVDGNGSETIDGNLTHSLSVQYGFLSIICDGSTWWITGQATGSIYG